MILRPTPSISRSLKIQIPRVPHRGFLGASSTRSNQNRIFDNVRTPNDLHTLTLLSAASNRPLITLWSASWCSTCQTIKPLVKGMIEDERVGEEEGGLGFAEVELDSTLIGDLGVKYMVGGINLRLQILEDADWGMQITSMPTLLAFSRQEAQFDTRLTRPEEMKNKERLREWLLNEARRGGRTGGEEGAVWGNIWERFAGFVLYLIWRELSYLIKLRQAYLLSAWSSSRISSRTVLFTNVPEEYLTHQRLHRMFSGVSQVWLVSDFADLEEQVDDMNKTALKLEGGEMKLIQKAVKAAMKGKKGSGADGQTTQPKPTSWNEFLASKDRPTHRLKFLIGKKVDTIDYGKDHLRELLPEVQASQRSHIAGKEKLLNAVFIEFETMAAAQTASAIIIHDKPATFVARQTGILPGEVIWKNLKMNSWDRSLRRGLATAFIFAMILFWSLPVAVVGIISNVNYLTANVAFLRWIDDIPQVILGVVTGLLPSVLLAVLMSLVPIICRLVAKLAGAITLSEVEQQTQSWYFAFQVIQVFLITTFTSGATAVASQIVSNPTSAVSLLAKNLPKASNFYISYFVLFGTAQAAKYLINIGGLVGIFILSKFASTPRKKYNKWMALTAPSWGSEYPVWTNLGVIAISYAIIAPLVLGFSTVGLALIYIAYKYNMLYVFTTDVDTKGACYARAMQQLMVGVYLAEFCLLGLFAINIGNSAVAVGPLILQIILIIVTIIVHIAMRKKLYPLVATLPLNFLEESDNRHRRAGIGKSVSDEGTARNDSNDMHPGYEDEIITSGPEGTGLVSGAAANFGNAYKTKTETDDIANGAGRPQKRSLFQRLVKPQSQSAAEMSASLNARFREPIQPYDVQEARKAYLHPAIVEEPPVIWLARDPLGVSMKEVGELKEKLTEHGVEVTDEGAIVNQKGKVEWVEESASQAPLWEGRVTY
ncbi:uncharacterized protein N0V89_006934 [Didymosphaeria variabile]|uniref:DUF221-domain-containing protein n=1 Tax=Didymosphaeria variabile TaxID=1932322 RepID=A0A9W8XJW7_9PLEO|nr:uncharacterized protein N0V89_006934 [Didymosphaeria variabile]KAJ4351591.1 hypothetical protein N0V89_006934 [Didymosphaeria variabile]